jgi:RNA polymerase sigma-70 factor, ECF subfamily
VNDSARLGEIYRTEYPRCIATLIRVLGDVDLAEDAVAEAFARAAQRWPVDGYPPNPGGWITTTARNCALDHLRRESSRPQRHRDAELVYASGGEPEVAPMTNFEGFGNLDDLDVVPDDQLRLIFLCCHPALAPDAQVALTLRLLCGLETPEIARAFLVPEATMAQRLVRAKRKIRDNKMAYRIPSASELPDRLPHVLAAIYLVYNEGYTATAGELTRSDLTSEAIRLARLLVGLMPDEVEALGLLALLLLTEARAPARTDDAGNLVRLADQDRTQWDRVLIDEGHQLVRRCLRSNHPGPYQLQAAIAAVHTDAASAAATDWSQIGALYDQLFACQPTAIVALNRAIAVAELRGPRAGLDALDGLDLDGYHLFHATRAEYLQQLGQSAGAVVAYDRAIELTTNAAERRHLVERRALVVPTQGTPRRPSK